MWHGGAQKGGERASVPENKEGTMKKPIPLALIVIGLMLSASAQAWWGSSGEEPSGEVMSLLINAQTGGVEGGSISANAPSIGRLNTVENLTRITASTARTHTAIRVSVYDVGDLPGGENRPAPATGAWIRVKGNHANILRQGNHRVFNVSPGRYTVSAFRRVPVEYRELPCGRPKSVTVHKGEAHVNLYCSGK
jgi:hypothetical protein